jgi:hypothetical protein
MAGDLKQIVGAILTPEILAELDRLQAQGAEIEGSRQDDVLLANVLTEGDHAPCATPPPLGGNKENGLFVPDCSSSRIPMGD